MRAAEAAYQVLKEHGEPMDVQDLLDETLTRMNLDREPEKASRVYTEINWDVRFQFRGEAKWGLKEWTPRAGTGKTSPGAARERAEEREDDDEGEEDEGWR